MQKTHKTIIGLDLSLNTLDSAEKKSNTKEEYSDQKYAQNDTVDTTKEVRIQKRIDVFANPVAFDHGIEQVAEGINQYGQEWSG